MLQCSLLTPICQKDTPPPGVISRIIPCLGEKYYLETVMDPEVKYLLSLGAIRERAKLVQEAAAAAKLNHFDVHEDRLDSVADFVTAVIKVLGLIRTLLSRSPQFP
jgi:hypothetical protein